MPEQRTLMAVHAHPDDEASSTGGVLALYGSHGVRTVVVTCTNGEFGDGPGGIKPGEPGHDPAAVAATRLAELKESCRILGVTHSEVLGYHDSGMADWEFKDQSDVFCNVPLPESSARLAALMEQYRPDVVITYDNQDGYNHPDHLRAHEITVAAVEQTAIPAKLYFIAFRPSVFQNLRERMVELGFDWPEMEINEETRARMEAVEERITTAVDISEVVERKGDALRAHASQIEDSWLGRMPPELVREAFGLETFVRVRDTTGAPLPETDLFAGLS